MFDTLEIGPVPSEESCQQVGTADYDPIAAREECKRFMALVERLFPNKPVNAYFKVKANLHDFGTYYEVVVKYDPEDELATKYAYAVESNSPLTWDDEVVRHWNDSRPPVTVSGDNSICGGCGACLEVEPHHSDCISASLG